MKKADWAILLCAAVAVAVPIVLNNTAGSLRWVYVSWPPSFVPPGTAAVIEAVRHPAFNFTPVVILVGLLVLARSALTPEKKLFWVTCILVCLAVLTIAFIVVAVDPYTGCHIGEPLKSL